MNTTRRNVLVAALMVLAILLALGAWLIHGNPSRHAISEFEGRRPKLVNIDIEKVPSVQLVRTIGWGAGEAPKPADGLAVNRWADGLNHPRTMLVLPNGDVLVAETNSPKREGGGISGWVERTFMKRVGAGGASPDRIVLLRPAAGGDRAGERFELRREGLASPSGMAWANGTLYVANHDAVLAFPFTPGQTRIDGAPRIVARLPAGGQHWMRNLQLSADGKSLFVAVGSASNIGENGMDKEARRAAILQIDLATGTLRAYAAGMRNPNGMAINPASGELWAVVNERDMLGPDLVPDYLTNVPVGAHYGWPWYYWKEYNDPRVDAPMPEFLTDYARKPEYALGPHVAALGLAFTKGGERMGSRFANGAFIARHGSWNRKPAVGYDVVFVPFDARGNPLGLPVPVLTGFLASQDTTHGRPTWVAWAGDGSLLVSDDTAGVIWRVVAPGAPPSAAIRPVETAHMPPQRSLNSEATIKYGASFGGDQKVEQQAGHSY